MASSDFIDPYLDPGSGLLRNKVGAQTKSALDDAEGALSFARLVQIMDHPVKPTGDLDELRTVDIRKNEEGAQFSGLTAAEINKAMRVWLCRNHPKAKAPRRKTTQAHAGDHQTIPGIPGGNTDPQSM